MMWKCTRNYRKVILVGGKGLDCFTPIDQLCLMTPLTKPELFLLFMLMLDKDWPPVGAVRDFFQMQVAAIKGLTVW